MENFESFPLVATAARHVLSQAGNAEQLLAELGPAVAMELGVLRSMLAERICRRLIQTLAAIDPQRADKVVLERARHTCGTLADRILKDSDFLTHLSKWLSVNIAFWLWKGDAVDSIDGESVAGLVGVFAENQAQIVTETLSPPLASLSSLAELLGLRSKASGPAPAPDIPAGMMLALSDRQFQMLREALSKSGFGQHDGTPWPTAPLSGGGIAQLRPPSADDNRWLPTERRDAWAETMWRQQRELSDRDADVLDALCSLYLTTARHPDQAVTADVGDLLALRGLKPKKGGGGRRGGYEIEQREEVMRALAHIQNLWIDIAEVDVPGLSSRPDTAGAETRTLQSRPFVITDRLGRKRLDGSFETEQFVFRPGRAFSAFLLNGGRHLLFEKALHYDPYRRRWEKRLTRYFSWHWGDGGGQAHGVGRLLEVVGPLAAPIDRSKTRARLEKALSILRDDGVLAAWRYDIPPSPATRHSWWEAWLATTILVEAPAPVSRYYALERTGDDLGSRLRARRRARGLTQGDLAGALGVTQSLLSKIETGRATVSATLRGVAEEWLGSL
jgi:DNA-binding XRE family transcriptional regulator